MKLAGRRSCCSLRQCHHQAGTWRHFRVQFTAVEAPLHQLHKCYQMPQVLPSLKWELDFGTGRDQFGRLEPLGGLMKCVLIFPLTFFFPLLFLSPLTPQLWRRSRTLSTVMTGKINPRIHKHTHPEGHGPRLLVREPISTVITLRSHFRMEGGQSARMPRSPCAPFPSLPLFFLPTLQTGNGEIQLQTTGPKCLIRRGPTAPAEPSAAPGGGGAGRRREKTGRWQ